MNDNKMVLDDLKWLTFWGRHLTESAAEKVQQINPLLRQLVGVGLDVPTAVLGPLLHTTKPTEDVGNGTTGRSLRAALLVPDGIGVVVWNDAQNESVKRLREGQVNHVRVEFVPFASCDADTQRQLAPHIETLLERLYITLK